MASTYLTNTNPTAGNRTKGTISVWFKRSGISSSQYLYSERYDNNNMGYIELKSNDQLNFQSTDGGSVQAQIQTNRVFRDTNAWYHLVAAWDSTQSTASDRIKIYINGVQETSFAVNSPPSQNTNLYFGVGSSSYPIHIGRRGDNASYFDGSMSHFHRVDNQQLAQTVFGSTDSTTGEWKINTSPSITYTGSSSFNFFVLKDGNSVTDQSGQSNNLTVGGGTLTKTEDNPSNVFATGNPLMVKLGTWSNGNNSIVGSTSSQVRPQMWSTIGAKSGKFYAEAKYTDVAGGMVGVSDYTGTMDMIRTGVYQGHATNSVGFWQGGDKYVENNSVSWGNSWSNNDIIQIAMDLDNMCVYFGINGTWQENGDPTSGANKTGGITIPNSRNEEYFMSWGDGSSSNSATCHVNYGNGYFGTTAVSSAGTNASGIGIFEYDVPTGYTALSTKGLNE